MVTSRSAAELDFSACPFRGGSIHYIKLRSRGSSQITSRCSLQARKYGLHAGGSSSYHSRPRSSVVWNVWEAVAQPLPAHCMWAFQETWPRHFHPLAKQHRALSCHGGCGCLTHTSLWSRQCACSPGCQIWPGSLDEDRTMAWGLAACLARMRRDRVLVGGSIGEGGAMKKII